MNLERIAGIGAFALVAAGIAIGFAVIGSPNRMRTIELDHRRVSDLQSIARSIHYVASHGRSETATAPPRRRDDWPRDPETGKPYAYERLSPTRYFLCATFGLPSDADGAAWVSAGWKHEVGRTCYRLDATVEDSHPEVVLPTLRVRESPAVLAVY
jgi:hypothetical protein